MNLLVARCGSVLLSLLLLGALALSVMAPGTRAAAGRASSTGLWWNPAEPGWGLSLTEQEGTTFVAWYTYTADGNATWLMMSACAATATGCAGDVFRVSGGKSLGTGWAGANPQAVKVGVGRLDFSDENNGRFDFTLDGVSASKSITRLSVATGAPPVSDYTGVWWNPLESGWGVTLTHQASTVFAVVFTYDDAGTPRWYFASNCVVASAVCTGDLFQALGGTPPTAAWSGAGLSNRRVGSLTIAFSGTSLAAMRPTLAGQASETTLARLTFAATAPMEASLGATLQRPVFQCGTGADTLTADAAPGSLAVFESGPVRPVALSADGNRLYVTNAPANCLEIYAVEGDTLRLASTLSVGMEPVAVAERSADEVWVVNHLSDSVSVVRLDGTPRVLRTLWVGDEPRDIVFAGPRRDRAFITAAARGQNRPGFSDTLLTTPGTGRADVWVFDATNLGSTPGGTPLALLTLFADVPRALAVSNDGNTVYAAAFMSGNGTTTLERNVVLGGKPATPVSKDGVTPPPTGLIVRKSGNAWRDETGRDWAASVRFDLPDYDVFAIDARDTPRLLHSVRGVGTTLFNMAVHPVSGRLYVSNTEAQNQIRFEGTGAAGSTVRGRIAESRISVVDVAAGSVDPVHLNRHVDFSLPQGQSIPAAEKAKSLAQPTALVISPDGETLYVAAFGSAKVAALATATLSSAGFAADASRHIAAPDGPAGLALNRDGSRLYVYSRIAHGLSVIDTRSRALLSRTALFTPEPARVVAGRRILYDATLSSANGTSACASCHVFGDMDHLAWDLGTSDEQTQNNPNGYVANSLRTTFRFHPQKGPMTTQTLRGMAGNGPLHWRGDRTGSTRTMVRGTLESLEEAAFKEFNPAFVSLLGREAQLSDEDMQAFTDFAMALAVPPNPVRALDNSLTASQQAGRDIYFNRSNITGTGSCNHCHTLSETAGKFGTSGLMTFEGIRITENFKVPQLRNMYQKAGMYGIAATSGNSTGAQIRGFGFSHDGSIDTLNSFFSDIVFNFPAPAATTRAQVISFVMAMDSDWLPIVGQQVTWRPSSDAGTEGRLALLKQQAAVTSPRRACDLVARVARDGSPYSGLYQSDGSWLMQGGLRISDAHLRQLASNSQPITYSCHTPGSGRRIALNAHP
jgi:DNA-binding beta-propeller fold protein YncE